MHFGKRKEERGGGDYFLKTLCASEAYAAPRCPECQRRAWRRVRPACREAGVISATPGRRSRCGCFGAEPLHRASSSGERAGAAAPRTSPSRSRGRREAGDPGLSRDRNRLRFSSAGSAPPGPVPEGLIRVYSMRFCPFAERTRLVLEAKGIK